MNHFEHLSEILSKIEKGEEKLSAFYIAFWKIAIQIPIDKFSSLITRAKRNSTTSAEDMAPHALAQGFFYAFYPNYGDAYESLMDSIEMFRKTDDKAGEGAANAILAIYYKNAGELEKAQSCVQKSIEYIENINTYIYFSMIAHYQGGEINHLLKDYDAAIKYYNKGLELSEINASNQTIQARMYNGIGNIYLETERLETAIEHFNKSLEVIKHIPNNLLQSKNYADIGKYHYKKGEYDKALEFQIKSVEIRKENQLKNPLITNYIELAELYLIQNKLQEALESAHLAEKIATELNVKIKLYQAYLTIFTIYEKMGDSALALEYFKKYHACKDEVLNQENARKIKQLSMLHEMENMQKEKEIVQLRNVVLKEALDEIEASVRYARRIQKAILPSNSFVKECLPHSFILYKAKDVVAGDFYWLEKVGDTVLFAAADCTGHGVPGAMVSVVCSNALNRAVNEYDIIDPGKLLEKTCGLVVSQFEKSEEQVNDGMDISLCSIDYRSNILTWCGANNPLWIIRDGELLIYSPIKRPIGKHLNADEFVTTKFELRDNDAIYIFTDGYKDQFGGKLGKKFKTSAMKELLLSIQDRDIEEQGEIINQKFENWKGELEQVDDVCVIGVKFKSKNK